MDGLKDKLRGRVVIAGIGNALRGDDGAGPALVRRLQESMSVAPNPNMLLLDAGEVPENYLSRITDFRPDTILLVDAVDFKGLPGTIKVVEEEKISEEGFSTHNSSLRLVIKFLKEETEADILLLGIQPQGIQMMTGLSTPVKQAITKIEECIKQGIGEKFG